MSENRKKSIIEIHFGYAYWQKGHVEEAISCLRQAVRFDPNFVMARIALAEALQKKETAGTRF